MAILNGTRAARRNITVQLIDSYASWIEIDLKRRTTITPNIAPFVIGTILNAEKIMVVKEGNLVGFDNHDNLVKNNEVYKELFSAWNLVN